jgi:tetrahydromethanopterin S-methyltransferase subunit G
MTEALGLIAVVLAIAANTAALWLKMTDLSKEMGRLAGRFDQFEKRVDARFDEIERRLDRIDARLDKVPS